MQSTEPINSGQPRSYETDNRTFLYENMEKSQALQSDSNTFSYKIDNPTIITQNLSNILFNEEFSDIVLICKGEEIQNDMDKIKIKKGPNSNNIFAHR